MAQDSLLRYNTMTLLNLCHVFLEKECLRLSINFEGPTLYQRGLEGVHHVGSGVAHDSFLSYKFMLNPMRRWQGVYPLMLNF